MSQEKWKITTGLRDEKDVRYFYYLLVIMMGTLNERNVASG
jgi:hypothetical protein